MVGFAGLLPDKRTKPLTGIGGDNGLTPLSDATRQHVAHFGACAGGVLRTMISPDMYFPGRHSRDLGHFFLAVGSYSS